MLKGWTALIDTSKLAGWVRAGVAAGLGLIVARWPGLGQWIDPATQDAIGMAISTAVVGAWSHAAKQIDG